MSAKKKIVVRKNEANLLIDAPKLIVKQEKISDDDLLMDVPTQPVVPTPSVPTLAVLIERVQSLEARACKAELYAQNLSTQLVNLRQTQDAAFTKLKHTGVLKVYDRISAT